jgi:hypothetical protein
MCVLNHDFLDYARNKKNGIPFCKGRALNADRSIGTPRFLFGTTSNNDFYMRTE